MSRTEENCVMVATVAVALLVLFLAIAGPVIEKAYGYEARGNVDKVCVDMATTLEQARACVHGADL